ncbi:MAG: YtxH domain-containing protein [Rubrobacteraceae bacterium]|uniref:YtxH domain-containing protein n=1 Tax=Rubrobacter naiadicus TaxID=1392641 RepID=UPI00235EC2AB|nr:YtxH domain-containing protein [Rubrobacter naiadicus]MBX6763158.1 YtxH domain-containing protein [Rubrobacteraceae bacterium]MCL6437555.1 YtxH domain-containing protein [Rubrobacteraceae bacterium]
MSNRERLGTFVLGAVAGIVTGMFFAPRSGRELRNLLADRVGEMRERSREGYFEAQERMRERFAGRAGHRVSGGNGGTTLPDEEELYERVRRTQERIRARLREDAADRDGRSG